MRVRTRQGALWLVAVVSMFVAPVVCSADDLADAIASRDRGEYKLARTALEALQAARPDDVAVTLALARTLVDSGDRAVALTLVEPLTKEPRAQAIHGEILLGRGEHDRAREVLTRGGADPECLVLLGQLCEATGKRDEARTHYQSVVAPGRSGSTDPRFVRAFAQASAGLERFQDAMDAFTAAQELAPGDATIRFLAGDLFTAKYQFQDGLKEFEDGLGKNPNHALCLMGKASLGGNFEQARQLARASLAVDPQQEEAHLVLGMMDLMEEDLVAAAGCFDQALAANPKSIEALAHRASVDWLNGDTAAFQQREALWSATAPGLARPYLVLGDVCLKRRRTPDAEVFYKKAVTLDPDYPEAEAAYARLMMDDAREVEARQRLEKAFDRDPYQYRTLNMIRLLDYMEKDFSVVATPHFLIKCDSVREDYLGRMYGTLFEKFYPSLLKRFRTTHKKRIVVEVFPGNDWFAARVSGTPWIGITGGCFGHLIAAESPNTGVPGTSNRHEVLRHEIVHAINLQQTHWRLPFWMAEGLASHEERLPRSGYRLQLLKRGLALGDLLPLSRLNAGFHRPKTGLDIHLAYYQAELAVDYMEKTFGFDRVIDALEGFAAGAGTPAQVFQKAFGVDFPTLEAGVMGHWKSVADGSPERLMATPDDLDALEKRAAGGEAQALGDYVWACLATGHAPRAVAPLKKLVKENKDKAWVLSLAGDFMITRKDESRARTYYEAALARDTRDFWGQMGLGELLAKEGQASLDCFAAAHRDFPQMPQPVKQLLSRFSTKMNDDKVFELLRSNARLELHQAAPWKTLVAAELAKGNLARAREALDELLHIHTVDPEVHRLAASVCLAEGDVDRQLDHLELALGLTVYPLHLQSKPGTSRPKLEAELPKATGLQRRAWVRVAARAGGKDALELLEGRLMDPDVEVVHEAAVALAQLRDPKSVEPLMAALGCKGPGHCSERVLEALRRVSARGLEKPQEWTAWWTPRKVKPREDWLLESMEAAGYKANWEEPKEEIPALLKALGDSRWWVRENAWFELSQSAKRGYGRGAFGPHPTDQEGWWDEPRREAIAQFQAWWDKKKAKL